MATPGPIVLETVTLFKYVPLAADGLDRTICSMKASRFSSSCSSENDAFPMGACTFPVLSTRNSILPALISFTARSMSNVTVPAFGVGISPTRSQNTAERPDLPHEVRGGDTNVEVQPTALDLLDELDPDVVRSGGFGLRLLFALGNHQDAHRLAGAVREYDRAPD